MTDDQYPPPVPASDAETAEAGTPSAALPCGESAEANNELSEPVRAHDARFRVLIVDDERAVLQVLDEMLQIQGYETVALTSPVEALKKAKRSKFDALVLDVFMPEMSGMLFHAKLRVFEPELARRTVFISGYVSRDELRDHLQTSPYFLEKPFRAQDLHVMVEKVLTAAPRR